MMRGALPDRRRSHLCQSAPARKYSNTSLAWPTHPPSGTLFRKWRGVRSRPFGL